LLTAAGCVSEQGRKKLDLGVSPMAGPLADSAGYRDTIGAYTYYEGLRPMRVRGYGLVVGLGLNGSRDCPRNIYDQLVQSLYKRYAFSTPTVGVESVTPERMIDDLDTAVVMVQGDIPPGASKGTRFDVAVMALPGTQTKSLEGGRLFGMDLEMFRTVSETSSIPGQRLAWAEGPVFQNPFSGGDAATQGSALDGVVIGGGVALQDRRVRLVLIEPSYQRARQVQDRINAHFPGPQKTAEALSPSYVQIRIPEEFRDDAAHFLALVRALYLSADPQFQSIRAKALADEFGRPQAPFALISLALEGLGRAALPELDRLYASPKDHVGFFAAAAGLRLDDNLAADAMAAHAGDPKCEFRFHAIRALGEARTIAGTAMSLRGLLHDEDPRVQAAAYEALLARGDTSIDSRPVGEDNFSLDFVPTERSSFIYVKRTGARRIALFGRNPRLTPPLLYRAPDGSVTITAQNGDTALTLLRVAVPSGAVSPPITAPLDVASLIRLLGSTAGVDADGNATGLGLGYGSIARALYHLCEDGAASAKLILEQPNAAELFGPARDQERPESEL
jgi:hypothetical protein